jgi:ferrochelatase
MLAHYISRRRASLARANYAKLGGASPLLPNTKLQARVLEAALGDTGDVRCFIAMRYWHPVADETARDVKAFGPDEVVLLPLYPQYSATTSGSSMADWARAASGAGLDVPTRAVCCYPDMPGFVETMTDLTVEAWTRAAHAGVPRILFSAHGLPERNIAAGDPYQWQVQLSAAAIARAVEAHLGHELDWRITYQSRVGRLVWIGPYTETVSEHVETLVELDIEYRELALRHGALAYERVRTVNEDGPFIEGLAGLVRNAVGPGPRIACGSGGRRCPAEWARCPCPVDSMSGAG